MPWTDVNRLARKIEEAEKVAKSLYNKHRASIFHTMAQRNASWANYMAAHKKARNLIAQLKTMNQDAFQVQLYKIENKRENIRKNLNKVMEGYGLGKNELIDNVFGEYSHWYLRQGPMKQANKIQNLEAKIERLPTTNNYNRRKKAVAKLAIQYAKVGLEEKALKKAINLRKRHLGPEARNKFRLVFNNIKYGPAGTRTLEARRRFPGYTPPTLENYARLERERNRLLRQRN